MQEGIQFLLGEINFCLCLTCGKAKPPHGGQGTLTIPAQPTMSPAKGRPLALSIAGAATLFQHKLQHHWSCHCQPFQAALPPAPAAARSHCPGLDLPFTFMPFHFPASHSSVAPSAARGMGAQGWIHPHVQGHSPIPVPPAAHQPQQGHCSLKQCHGSAMHSSQQSHAHSNNCKRQIIVVV